MGYEIISFRPGEVLFAVVCQYRTVFTSHNVSRLLLDELRENLDKNCVAALSIDLPRFFQRFHLQIAYMIYELE